jgi:fluoride ion exporter CrcB/FEX
MSLGLKHIPEESKNVHFRPFAFLQVGCFLMGAIGFAWRECILSRSKPLYVSLTAGVLGSLTTYSGFNQDMVNLFVEGDWAQALFGLLIGGNRRSYPLFVVARGLVRCSGPIPLVPFRSVLVLVLLFCSMKGRGTIAV